MKFETTRLHDALRMLVPCVWIAVTLGVIGGARMLAGMPDIPVWWYVAWAVLGVVLGVLGVVGIGVVGPVRGGRTRAAYCTVATRYAQRLALTAVIACAAGLALVTFADGWRESFDIGTADVFPAIALLSPVLAWLTYLGVPGTNRDLNQAPRHSEPPRM